MTQDEIISMAREADVSFRGDWDEMALVAFAKLVAAHERELCAKVCEDNADDGTEGVWDDACLNCATHIRDRGQQ